MSCFTEEGPEPMEHLAKDAPAPKWKRSVKKTGTGSSSGSGSGNGGGSGGGSRSGGGSGKWFPNFPESPYPPKVIPRQEKATKKKTPK